MRVDGADGPLALGPKGSIRDRLTPPGRVEGFRSRELYSTAALARYGAKGAIFYTAFGGENHTTALRASEMHSPFGGWRHHLSAPLGSVSLDSQSPTAPCESSSLATASGGTIKLRYAVSCL